MKLPQECWQFDWRCIWHREEGRSPFAWPVDVDGEAPWGRSDLLKEETTSWSPGESPCDTDTDDTVTMSWVRKSFFPSQGWSNLSLYATGVCSKKNEIFGLYLPYLYCEVWEQITRYFKNSINKNNQKLPVTSRWIFMQKFQHLEKKSQLPRFSSTFLAQSTADNTIPIPTGHTRCIKWVAFIHIVFVSCYKTHLVSRDNKNIAMLPLKPCRLSWQKVWGRW